LGKFIVYTIVLVWTIPTFGVFISSFRTETDVKTTGWWTTLWHPHFTFSNYTSVLGTKNGGDNLAHFFANSLRITIPSVIVSVGIAALASYALSWINFKGRDWTFVAIVTLLVVPLQMALIPLSRLITGGGHITIPGLNCSSTHLNFLCGKIPHHAFTLFPNLGLKNTLTPVIIAHTCFGLPFCVFILKNFMSSLPREVMEAARVDGAGHLTMFRKIVLPLSVPALASLGIFQFVYIWNDYLVAQVFGGSKNYPLVYQLASISGSRGSSWHLLTAATFLSMILPLAVFFSLQKYFVKGLLAGAVKG
jgi:alpha-glucoside transport system permease protein